LRSTSPKKSEDAKRAGSDRPHNFLIVPTDGGTFYCEMRLDTEEKRKALVTQLKALEQQYNLEIRIEDRPD